MSIKRPVKQIDTSGQLSLYLEDNVAVSDRKKSSANTTRVFVEPDPERIQIGLKEHLQRSDQRHVFVIDELLKQQDWSAFEADYASTGRAPYAPRLMIGLILFGVMQGKSSLRELQTLSRDSLGCIWLSSGIMPDHSVIGRFICRHAFLLSGDFFEQLTRSVLSYTHSGVDYTSGDGTVVEAAASRYKTIKREALEQRIEREQQLIEKEENDSDAPDPKIKAKRHARLKKLIEAEKQLSEREATRKAKSKSPEGIQINPEEPDAVNQPLKQQGFGISYRPGVLANKERVIVGHGVDTTSETRVAIESLAMASRFGQLHESNWDAGYSNTEMLLQQAKYDVTFLIPEGQLGSFKKPGSKKYSKSQFIYDAQSDTYTCPAGKSLKVRGQNKAAATRQSSTRYGTSACAGCDQRERCTSSKNGREINRFEHDELREEMRERMQDESAQARYRQRAAQPEPVFSHLQHQQNFTRFTRKGLVGAKLEFSLQVLAHNVSRVVAYWHKTPFLLALKWLSICHSRLLAVYRNHIRSLKRYLSVTQHDALVY